jgi:TolB-like protein
VFQLVRSRRRIREALHPRSHRAAVAAACLLTSIALPAAAAPVRDGFAAVAVFPVENLSAGPIPADRIRQYLIENLAAQGVTVLGIPRLEAFMAQHRVRYTAGIDTPTAASLRQEAGVDGVVFASVERSSDAVPPKIALVVRLVSIKAVPVIVWADDAGMAGDDAPGFLELGIVNDYERLLSRALKLLTRSLLDYIQTGETGSRPKRASKFRPKSAYRAVQIESGRPASVAVLPFINLSERRNAGEILALLFMRHLSSFRQLRVVETGVVRQQLLAARIIMDSGPSVRDAETVAALMDADFVLGGRVTRYVDYEGAGGVPRVEFSTVMIERKTRKVVWSSDSYNEGSDGVLFFGRGTSKTAHAMATQMVRLTAEMIADGQR